jgi:hypothetical protein
MNEKSTMRAQAWDDEPDNLGERPNDTHLKETSMLRRTVIFFAVTVGLPVLTAIAIAWAR